LVPEVDRDPEGAVNALLEFAGRFGCKPVLFHTEDVWMFAMGRREGEVRKVCILPSSPWTLCESILNKRKLYELAAKAGVPAPRTLCFQCFEDLCDASDRLPMPCIVKPETTPRFLDALPEEARRETSHSTKRFQDAAGLRRWCALLIEARVKVPVLVQEFIPGGAETLFTLTSYSDRAGKLVVGSVGHKIRQSPPDAGVITVGRLRHEPVLYDQGRRLLDALGFHGMANTEYKHDVRDGLYKLMEINPRAGKWNSSCLVAGLNLPAIAYRDMLGIGYDGPPYSTAADGTLWIDHWEDARNCLHSYRCAGYNTAHLGLLGWLKAIRGPRKDATWDLADPLPGLAYGFGFCRRLAKATFSKVWRGLIHK
jgi:predicted ATP-grasp superfamily ATP-dependent carboligase